MSINKQAYTELTAELSHRKITLVAVSKIKPVEDIMALYELGQRDFGENYVQEMVDKASRLPKDIRWHFIGHLQRNKVKYIVPFVHLIHGIDSSRLLKEVDKEAGKIGRNVNCLLQMHIASEETKFGMNEEELDELLKERDSLSNVNIQGLMGMASFSDNPDVVRYEFGGLKEIFDKHPGWTTLSMGMSGDYRTAIEEGSTMLRIGSLLFGARK